MQNNYFARREFKDILKKKCPHKEKVKVKNYIKKIKKTKCVACGKILREEPLK